MLARRGLRTPPANRRGGGERVLDRRGSGRQTAGMTPDIDVEDFRYTGKGKLSLRKRPTALKKPLHQSKEELVARLRKYQEEIDERQQQMFAQDQYAMLLVFQAMDAAGKDGTIKHVMSGINP